MMSERYDQEAILTYVEDQMPAERRGAFEQLMRDDAALRQLVADMIDDREGLLMLRGESAPAGLIDGAVGHLERRMLLDDDPQADEPSQLTGPIPIRSAPRRPAATRWLAAVGVAAALAISGAVMWRTLWIEQPADPLQLADAGGALKSRIEPATPAPLTQEMDLPGENDASRLGDSVARRRKDAAAIEPPRAESPLPQPSLATPPAPAPSSPSPEAAPSEPALAEPMATLADARSYDESKVAAGTTDPIEMSDSPVMERSLAGPAIAARELEQPPAMAKTSPVMAQTSPVAGVPAKLEQLAAAAAIEPAVTIAVGSPDPDDAHRQLKQWALSNQARLVLPPDSSLPSVHSAPSALSSPPPPKPTRQRVVLTMARSQIDGLVAYLNDNELARTAGVVTLRDQDPIDPPASRFSNFESAARQMPEDRPDSIPPYPIDWRSLLEQQLPLTPVRRTTPADPTILEQVQRVNVLVELNETAGE